MISESMSLIANAASGGVLGLIGGVFGKTFGLLDNWQKRKEKAEERAHELKLLDRELQRATAEMESEERIAASNAAAQMREASYQHDASFGLGSQWVVNTLRLVRPVLTVMLICTTAAIFFTLNEEERILKQQIINAVIFSTNAAFAWWFASRGVSK